MEQRQQKERDVHPRFDLIKAVTGELRPLQCQEETYYWYLWLAEQKRAA
jgi:hypothetical protein